MTDLGGGFANDVRSRALSRTHALYTRVSTQNTRHDPPGARVGVDNQTLVLAKLCIALPYGREAAQSYGVRMSILFSQLHAFKEQSGTCVLGVLASL